MVGYFKLTEKRPERRNPGQSDPLVTLLTLFGAVTAAVIVTAMLLITKAKPDTLHSVTEEFSFRRWWNPTITQYLFYLMVFGFIASTTGLVVNFKRLRRKYDNVRYNLVFLWLLSTMGIIIYFWKS